MDKKQYIIGFMGQSTVGKSRLISACIANKKIAKYIHEGNKSGKTKTNTIYQIKAHEGTKYSLKYKDCLSPFIRKKENKGSDEDVEYIFDFEEFKKKFTPIAEVGDFDGIDSFQKKPIDVEGLRDWTKKFQKSINERLVYETKQINSIDEELIAVCDRFEKELSYNDLFDLFIELDGSEKIRGVLNHYDLDSLILVDTRGVFDSPDKLRRTFSKDYVPDINVLMFDEKGVTDHLFEGIFNEIEPIFGKSFEVCIRTATPVNAKSATVENCINPRGYESYLNKFESILKKLEDKGVLEGETPFNIRLRENIGTVLPEIPIKEDNELTEEEDENNNDKYDDIICGLFNKLFELKKKEEESINYIIEKSKDPAYKLDLINSIILGGDFKVFKKYGERCYWAVNGNGRHLQPKPQAGKIQHHISHSFFFGEASSWIKEEYICNIVTYEAANFVEDAIAQVRENSESLSDNALSEYLFILKNVLSESLGSLSYWESYNSWSEGVRLKRIPKIHYKTAYEKAINFSKEGTIYYKLYEDRPLNREYASALLNCILETVIDLIKEKLKMDRIITEIETIKTT